MNTFLSTLLLVVAAMSGEARAECVTKGPVCYELRAAEFVFVGEVIDVSPGGDRQRVDFRVLENFKGASSTTLSLAFANYLEQARFSRGERVLVYASPTATVSGQLGVWDSSCGRARNVVTDDDPELLVLRTLTRALASGADEGAVSGRLELRGYTDFKLLSFPTGVGVTLRSIDGGATRWSMTTVSDNDGFLFLGVPSGRYTVTVESTGYDAAVVSVSVDRGQCVNIDSLWIRRRTP